MTKKTSKDKVVEVRILLRNDEGEAAEIKRDADYEWTFDGGVYPRTLKMINRLNEAFREHDTGKGEEE